MEKREVKEDTPLAKNSIEGSTQKWPPCATRALTCLAFFLFFLIDQLFITFVTEYVLYKSAMHYNESDYAATREQHQLCQNSNRDTIESEGTSNWTMIQDDVSRTVRLLNIAKLLPVFPVVLLLSVWSDVSGKRKPLLIIPTIGNIINAAILVLDVYVSAYNNSMLLVLGAVAAGISGGNVLFVAGSGALLAGNSSDEDRMKELAILEMCASLAMGIANLALGYTVLDMDFKHTAWFILMGAIAAFIISAILQESPHLNDYSGHYCSKLRDRFTLRSYPKYSFSIIIMYTIAYGFYIFIHIGQERTFVRYLAMTPICLGYTLIGWWMFAQGLLMAVGMFILPRCGLQSLDEAKMAYIGYISKAASTFSFTLANSESAVFGGKYFFMYNCF